jgi:hypothetical protein
MARAPRPPVKQGASLQARQRCAARTPRRALTRPGSPTSVAALRRGARSSSSSKRVARRGAALLAGCDAGLEPGSSPSHSPHDASPPCEPPPCDAPGPLNATGSWPCSTARPLPAVPQLGERRSGRCSGSTTEARRAAARPPRKPNAAAGERCARGCLRRVSLIAPPACAGLPARGPSGDKTTCAARGCAGPAGNSGTSRLCERTAVGPGETNDAPMV